MSQLIKPLSIAIDTSVLNSVANDFYSASTDKQNKANEFISFINSNGYVPIISYEHISEFLQTPVEADARKSFEIINQFSSVLWIKNKSSYGLMVGHVHDIIGNEIKAFLDGNSSFSEIISISKENAYVFGTGKEFTDTHSVYWPILRSHSLYNKQRKKEIASVLNLDFHISRETKISDLLKRKLINSEEVKKNVESSKSDFIDQIAKKGDRKLNDPQSVALDFHSTVSDDINQTIDQGEPETPEELCRALGFSKDDLIECNTFGELCELAAFKEQLKTYARTNNLNPKDLNRVRPKNIPSVKLINGVAEICRKGKSHASGSDLIDNDFLLFTLYCDYTILDKRTLEFLKQYLNTVPQYKKLVKSYFKLPDYGELSKYVPARK